MARRWIILWVEYLFFIQLLACLTFLYLSPHLKKNFETILEQQLGLSAYIDYFYISPTGRIKGRGVQLNGNFLQFGDIQLSAQDFSIEPKDFIYKVIWDQKENFSWKQVPYEVYIENVSLFSKQKNIFIHIPEIHLNLYDDDLQVHTSNLFASYNRQQIFINQISLQNKDQISHLSLSEFSTRYQENKITAETVGLFLDQPTKTLEIEMLKEVRLTNLKVTGENDINIQGARILKTAKKSWSVSIQGNYNETDFELKPNIKYIGNNKWSMRGDMMLPFNQQNLSYFIQGPISNTGQWEINLEDQYRNIFKIDITGSPEKEYLGTWSFQLRQLDFKPLDGPHISGYFYGGIAHHLESKMTKFHFQGHDINGGPGNTKGAKMEVKAFYDKNLLNIEELTISENKKWSARLQTKIDTLDWSPKAFQLNLKEFPLGQYTPKVDGLISADAQLNQHEFTAKVFTDQLFPNKDALQKMENFQVIVSGNASMFNFKQSFQQNGHENIIEVITEVNHLFNSPLQEKNGTLKHFRSKSPLFDLKLSNDTNAKINLRGLSIDHFQVDDQNKRLRDLSGSAYIPFFQASKFLIQARGKLDLSQMPPIANSPTKGIIHIENAIWDKGWSIKNLRADLIGEQLSIHPSSIFPAFHLHKFKSRLAQSSLLIDALTAQGKNGAKLNLKGQYHFFKRNLDLQINITGLNYKSKSYHMKYDLPNMLIKGNVLKLNIHGPIHIQQFLYSAPFDLLPSQDHNTVRKQTKPPDHLNFYHELNLEIHNKLPLQLKNNVGQLLFDIKNLKVHGPLHAPIWNGIIEKTTSPDNHISFPIQPIDISMKAKNVKLTFNDEPEWNPKLSLSAETIVDNTQIYLQCQQHLNSLQSKDFKLNSEPTYSKDEILTLLTTGHKPSQDIFSQKQGVSSEGQLPSVTIVKNSISPTPHAALKYEAKVAADSTPFEFSAFYSLNQYLELEMSQNSNDRSFVGLRLSHRSENWKNILHSLKIKNQNLNEQNFSVVWKFNGLDPLPILGIQSKLRKALNLIIPVLKEDDTKVSKEVMTDTISKFLLEQGYLFASFHIKELSRSKVRIARRNSEHYYYKYFSTISIDFKLGHQFILNDFHIEGWPTHIPMPYDIWLKKRSKRKPIYQYAHLKNFQNKVLSTLAEYGYPAAKITHVIIQRPTRPKKFNSVSFLTPSYEIHSYPKDQQLKDMDVSLKIDPGLEHSVEQIYFSGDVFINKETLKSITQYKNKLNYRESDFILYRDRLLKWYESQNYFGTQINYDILRSRYYPRVSLHMRINEGKRWKIGKITFKGLNKTSEAFLRAKLSIQRNQWANPLSLEKNIELLSNLNIFTTVDYQWVEKSQQSKELLITVTEKPRVNFSTKLGYENSKGFQGSFRIIYDNLMGKGRSLSFENDISSDETLRKAVYQHPKMLYGLDSQIALAQKIDLISIQEIENKQYLAELAVYKKWHSHLSQQYAVVYREDQSLSDRVPSLRIRVFSETYPKQRSLMPSAGFGFVGSSTIVSYLDAEHQQAYLGDYKISYGHKLGGSLFTPWIRHAHRYKFGEKLRLPLADRTFLGGTNSLRGFRQDEISGKDRQGGESLVSYGVQLFYAFNSWMDGTLFYEAGDVYSGDIDFDLQGLNKSIGFGVVLRTPIGPIQAFYGEPLDSRDGRFGIQLGTIF